MEHDRLEPDVRLARQARTRQVILGVLFVAGGVILLLHQLNIFYVFGLWPLLIVGLGVSRLLGACCAHGRRDGLWLLAIGLWLSLNEFTALRYRDTWPLLLVAIGGLIAWNAMAPPERCASCAGGHHGC